MGCNSTKSVVVVVDIRPQSEELRQSPVGQKNPESKYEPFTEYPTYTLLAKAQQEYAARGQPKPDVDSNGMPGLFPTPTSKATIFNRERSRNIDQHARNADKKLATGSYFDIVSYLTAPAEKDVDKVRAIFVWIASQSLGLVLESIKSIGTPENGTPLFWLSTILIKCNAIGYYYLFSELCSAANIPCRTVDNIIVKGAHYEVGDEDLGPSNKLSLVYVDGTWRIVDQFWGSQALSMVADANWVAIAGENGGNKHENSTERVIYQQNDFYFLTDPEMYIYEHWPQNPDEQLLVRPVTETEFYTMAYLRQEFFDYGLTTVSHPKCKIEVKADERSSVKVQIGLPSDGIPDLEFVLYKSRYNDEYNVVNGFPYKDFVFVEYIKNQSVMQFTVNLPKYGRYKLDIGASGSPFYAYCEYLILNEKPRYFEPYPRISNSQVTYGPTVESRQTYGLSPAVDEGAVIEATEGMVELEFISSQKTSIKHRLLRIETTASSATDKVNQVETTGSTCYYRSEHQLTIFIKFQKPGRYILEILSREESTLLFRYLINSDRGCSDMTPFPVGNVSDDGAYGVVPTSADQCYVKPLSHVRARFGWDYKDGGSSELAVEMSIVREGNFLAELFHCTTGKERKPRELHEYVHCEQVESKLVVFVRFTRHGMHKLNIVVGTNVVYQYLIIVGRVAAEAVPPFPTFNKQIWKNDFVLYEPRTKYLLHGSEVKFKLQVMRRTDKVIVIQSSGQLVLNCPTKDGCTWEGDVKVQVGDLDIVSVFHDEGSQEALIKYKILKEEEMNRIGKEQAQFANNAVKYTDECDKRRIVEAQGADKRQAEYERRVKQVDDDFVNNCDRIRREDEEILMADREKEEEEEEEEEQDEQSEYEDEVDSRGIDQHLEYERISCSLALQRLRDATMRKDIQRLRNAINECHELGVEEDDVSRAESLLALIMKKQQELQQACGSENRELIGDTLVSISKHRFDGTLKPDIRKANEKLQQLTARRDDDDELSLLTQALRALRRVNRPSSESVHVLIQTFLLLYGIDEFDTQEWRNCRRFLTTTWPGSLKEQILNFKPENVHPEVCARCVEMFRSVDEDAISRTHSDIRLLYILAKEQIEAAAEVCDECKPASINRQRALYLKPPIPDRFLPKRKDTYGLVRGKGGDF